MTKELEINQIALDLSHEASVLSAADRMIEIMADDDLFEEVNDENEEGFLIFGRFIDGEFQPCTLNELPAELQTFKPPMSDIREDYLAFCIALVNSDAGLQKLVRIFELFVEFRRFDEWDDDFNMLAEIPLFALTHYRPEYSYYYAIFINEGYFPDHDPQLAEDTFANLRPDHINLVYLVAGVLLQGHLDHLFNEFCPALLRKIVHTPEWLEKCHLAFSQALYDEYLRKTPRSRECEEMLKEWGSLEVSALASHTFDYFKEQLEANADYDGGAYDELLKSMNLEKVISYLEEIQTGAHPHFSDVYQQLREKREVVTAKSVEAVVHPQFQHRYLAHAGFIEFQGKQQLIGLEDARFVIQDPADASVLASFDLRSLLDPEQEDSLYTSATDFSLVPREPADNLGYDFASIHYIGKKLALWSLTREQPVALFDVNISQIANISPNGRWFAGLECEKSKRQDHRHRIRLFDLAERKEIAVSDWYEVDISALSISPDGGHVYFLGTKEETSLMYWQPDTRKTGTVCLLERRYRSDLYLGNYLVIDLKGEYVYLDHFKLCLKTGEATPLRPESARSVNLSADENLLLTLAGGKLLATDIHTGELYAQASDHQDGSLSMIEISNDRQWLVTTSDRGTKLWPLDKIRV